MSDIVIGAIKPELVDVTWPLVEEHIKMAIFESNDELDIDKMKQAVKDEDMLLLVVYKDGIIIASCTLEKRQFTSGKMVVNISTLGGTEMELWDDKLNDVIATLTLEHGCNEVYMIGRKGWEKYLKSKGYKHIHSVMSRKIEV